jgi:large subunit ribosomal protein L9
MDIILLERIVRLGGIGDVVSVKPGYARNYLLPQKKALRATESNRKLFELQRASLEARNAEAKAAAEKAAEGLNGQNFLMIRAAGESGQLYGSVGARDIVEVAAAAGFTIARSQVQLETPLKNIGFRTIKIRLHPEVEVEVNVKRRVKTLSDRNSKKTGSLKQLLLLRLRNSRLNSMVTSLDLKNPN